MVDYSLICLRKQWSQATLGNWTRQSEQKSDLTSTMEERGSGSTVLTWLVLGIKSEIILTTIFWFSAHRNRDRPKSKQFDVIKALGDAAFSFKFEDSDLLAGLTEGHTPDTHPHLYTEHCWDVENRGCVGETAFHVCFLMGTPTHMFCAKRILKWFPKVPKFLFLSSMGASSV